MKLAIVLAVAGVLGLAASRVISSESTTKPMHCNGFHAKLVKVDGDKLVLKTWAKDGEGKEVTVLTDSKTTVTVMEPKEVKVADLKPGMCVFVTPTEGTATKVTAWAKQCKECPKAATKPAGG